MYRNMVNAWLQPLSAEAGSPLALDEDGVCSFVRDAAECSVFVPGDRPVIYFYAPMMSLPEDDVAELFSSLLAHNFLCEDTGGAAFAIDRDNDLVVLNMAASLEGMTEQGFRDLVAHFSGNAAVWLERFEMYLTGAPDPDEAEEIPLPTEGVIRG